MRIKNRFFLGIVILIFGSALIGCSGSNGEQTTGMTDNNESEETDETSEEVEEAAEYTGDTNEELEPVTVKVRDMFGDEGKEFFEQLLAERYAHLSVEWVDIGDVTHSVQEMEEVISSGNLPDILLAVGDRDFQVIAELDLAYDLTEL
jgi:ABC-type glycerol-3-phosphate transport system substrate-binding protein